MLRVAILDANDKSNTGFIHTVTSIVGHWLAWECERAEIALVPAAEADLIFLVFAGATDWHQEARRELRAHKIEISAKKRKAAPYIIAGGAADAIPFTVLQTADAVAIGEAYQFVRNILGLVNHGADIPTVREWIEAYPHALERAQVEGIARDDARPWLLARPLDAPLASPDDWVDWEQPPVRIDDGVVRIIASKGCWLKCKFCATTYRQTYRQNEDSGAMLRTIKALTKRGERIQLVTNDVTDLPYFQQVPDHGKLSQQSLTLRGLQNPDNFNAVLRSKAKIIRIGVEGLSPRIRLAFGKPMTRDELLAMLVRLHDNKQMTHLFYIIAAPYETEEDWREYRAFYKELARAIQWGVCRIKYTSFIPDPPTPLARFLPATVYAERMAELKTWVTKNAATRHSMSVWARLLTTRINDYAASFGVDPRLIHGMLRHDETIDLAPALEDAYRMPWEVIDWPLPVEKRWRLGESYKKVMGVQPKAYALNAASLAARGVA